MMQLAADAAPRPSIASLLFACYDEGLRRRPTLQYLRECERQQWYSTSQIQELQARKLRTLLTHAATEVPHFADVLSRVGRRAADFSVTQDLAGLPIMTKEQVRADYGSFLSRSMSARNVLKATGGSTGDPFQFQYNRDSEYRRLAVMWRGYRWAGADIGRRSAYIWSWPYADKHGFRLAREVLYQRILGRTYFDIFALSEQQLPEIARRLGRLSPDTIVCYVSGGLAVARWLIDNNVRLTPPHGVITGAEPLHEAEREVLQRGFGAPVFNTYGSREFMLIGAECERHRGLHVSADNLIVETVDESGAPVTGRPGRVVITDLHNFGMPFIRYANGDVASISPDPCPCGRGLPLIEYVQGREADVIRLPDGRRLTGLFFVHLFKDFPAIRYYQVIQPSAAELCIRIVPMVKEPPPSMAPVLHSLRRALGEGVQIRIELVEQIPLTRAGKRRIVESHLHAS
jgi:phenylacetate-CoA ligase